MFQHTLLSSRANTDSSYYYSVQVFAIALSLISLLPLLSHTSSSCLKDYINTEIRSRDFPAHDVPISSKKPSPYNSIERVPHPWNLVSFSLLNLLKYSDIYTQPSIISEALYTPLINPSLTLSLTHAFSPLVILLQCFLPTLSKLRFLSYFVLFLSTYHHLI